MEELNSIPENTDRLSYERVEFLCDQAVFKGKVFKPKDIENCKGIVIFTHGLGYCDRQYAINGKYFSDNGYLMLIYNLRAHANTPGEWTLQNSVDDLTTGINFLTHKYDFKNKERICVIGHSTGALITLLASLKDSRIKFGSVVTTVTCLTHSYFHWFKSGFNQDVKEFFKTKGVLPPIIGRFMDDPNMINLYREGKIPVEELEIPHRYGMLRSESWNRFFHEIAYSVDVLDRANDFKIPLLLFRGEHDEVMDVQKTNELYKRLNKKVPSKLYVTDSKNHFHNDRWDMIQSETLKFFDEFCAYQYPTQQNVETKDILIIDDEMLVTKTLQSLLKKNGFTNITIAHNGTEAIEKIRDLMNKKKKPFDLIVSDIRMPGIDGIETIKRVKEIVSEAGAEQAAIIFITGYEGDRSKEQAKALGYVDYMYKPFDTEDFLTSVRKHIK